MLKRVQPQNPCKELETRVRLPHGPQLASKSDTLPEVERLSALMQLSAGAIDTAWASSMKVGTVLRLSGANDNVTFLLVCLPGARSDAFGTPRILWARSCGNGLAMIV